MDFLEVFLYAYVFILFSLFVLVFVAFVVRFVRNGFKIKTRFSTLLDDLHEILKKNDKKS